MRTVEKQIGNTLFIMSSEYSDKASETVAEKLERLILRHASDTESYLFDSGKPLDNTEIVREYGTDTIIKE